MGFSCGFGASKSAGKSVDYYKYEPLGGTTRRLWQRPSAGVCLKYRLHVLLATQVCKKTERYADRLFLPIFAAREIHSRCRLVESSVDGAAPLSVSRWTYLQPHNKRTIESGCIAFVDFIEFPDFSSVALWVSQGAVTDQPVKHFPTEQIDFNSCNDSMGTCACELLKKN